MLNSSDIPTPIRQFFNVATTSATGLDPSGDGGYEVCLEKGGDRLDRVGKDLDNGSPEFDNNGPESITTLVLGRENLRPVGEHCQGNAESVQAKGRESGYGNEKGIGSNGNEKGLDDTRSDTSVVGPSASGPDFLDIGDIGFGKNFGRKNFGRQSSFDPAGGKHWHGTVPGDSGNHSGNQGTNSTNTTNLHSLISETFRN
jgi:hypothetical protein